MPESAYEISKYAFVGRTLWDRDHPGETPGSVIRVLLIQVSPDSPVVDSHRRGRVLGPGGYFLACYEPGLADPTFALHYDTLDELRHGHDGRGHPSGRILSAAVDIALRELGLDQR